MTREEAIEVVKKNYPHVSFSGSQFESALRELVPELAESEDERMIKAILSAIRGGLDTEKFLEKHGTNYEEVEAYLEKQKEQKPVQSDVEKEYVRILKSIVSDFIRDKKPKDTLLYQDIFDWLEGRHVEQEHAEWKPQSEALEALMYAIEGRWEMIKPTSYLSRRLEDLYEGLVNNFDVDETLIADKDIEELKALKAEIDASMEQKSAEKQDYSGLSKLERAIHRGFLAAGVENVPVGIIKETAQECLAQMKPAEWSEEDEEMLNSCISSIEEAKENRYAYKETDGDTSYDHEIAWLKSLRPSWKPSEEQMAALYTAARESPIIKENGNYLYDLYEQLKKL